MSLAPSTSRRVGRVGPAALLLPTPPASSSSPPTGWVAGPPALCVVGLCRHCWTWGLGVCTHSGRSFPGGFITVPLLSWFPEAWGATLNVNVKSGLKKLPNSDRELHTRPDLFFYRPVCLVFKSLKNGFIVMPGANSMHQETLPSPCCLPKPGAGQRLTEVRVIVCACVTLNATSSGYRGMQPCSLSGITYVFRARSPSNCSCTPCGRAARSLPRARQRWMSAPATWASDSGHLPGLRGPPASSLCF